MPREYCLDVQAQLNTMRRLQPALTLAQGLCVGLVCLELCQEVRNPPSTRPPSPRSTTREYGEPDKRGNVQLLTASQPPKSKPKPKPVAQPRDKFLRLLNQLTPNGPRQEDVTALKSLAGLSSRNGAVLRGEDLVLCVPRKDHGGG